MTPRSYSYLDVSALDGVRDRLAAGDAALVLSAGLDEVIWANGPGAALFGHPGITSFVGNDPELSGAARRQISATPGFPDIGTGRSIAVRLARGVSSQTVMFAASGIGLPDGERAILLSVTDPLAGKRTDAERAERAISGLASNGGGVALVDGGGSVQAASAGFNELGIEPGTLAALTAEVANEADRMVKRLIETAHGALPAGIVRLADDPALNLLMIADDPGGEAEAEDDADATGTVLAMPVRDEARSVQGDETAAHTASETPSPDTADDGDTAAETVDAGTGESETQAGAAPQETASRGKPGQEDGWYFNGDKDGAKNTPAEASGKPTETADAHNDAGEAAGHDVMGAPPDLASAPVRFVWRTDAEGRFSALSEEFRAAFGPEASDIIGREFAEVAAAFNLDPAGEIAGLMTRRDTWSGRSVLWPIAGTDLVAPVDLAALPVYSRDGTFEGFRGFGIARMGDAVVDDNALGLALTGELPAEDSGGVEEIIAAPDDFAAGEGEHDPFEGEVPALSLEGSPERRDSDKVIRLAERRNPPMVRGLSSSEQHNFQEIGKRLREFGSEQEQDAGEADETAAPPGDADQPEVTRTETDADSEALETTTDAVGEQGTAAVSKAPEAAAEESQGSASDEDEVEAGSVEAAATTDQEQEEQTSSVAETTAESDDAVAAGTDETDAATGEEMESDETGGDETVVEASEDGEDATGDESVSDAAGELPVSGADETSVAAVEEPSGDDSEPATTEEIAEPAEAATEETIEAEGETPGETVSEAIAYETPAPVAPAEDRKSRTPVGLSAFLPSAFATGGAADAALGVDSAVLSRLPLPLLIHAGDELHYANREFLNLTGYRSLAEFDLAGGLGAIFADPYGADAGSDQKLKLRTRDGDEFPVHAFLQSVGWQGGKALLLALRRADNVEVAAEQEQSTADLEARLAELRTIIDTATDGVVIIDNDGAVRSVSKPAEALFGYNADDITGKPFTSLFAIESQRPAREYLDGLAGNGVASVLNDGREVIGREAQGRFIPLFMTIGRLPGSSGFCAVLRDITHWKRAEEELTEAKAVAERASSQKTEFLARVSHEIRTPLNAIIGFSELMIDEKFGPIGSERYRDYLRDINRSGNHVLDLVNDLLDISKIEAGQQELSYEAVSLNDVLGEAVAMMQPQANRERVIIRSSFSSRLPDVVADLRSIRQIALNLLSNAIRYTPAGGQVIVSTAYESSGDIAMRVRDTGVGMAAADIEHALKPFKQVNALKRPRGDGTGLGLPLTKAMVEANRARFVIQSTPGEGTLVEIIFPSTRVLAD
jgi:PAS domain S-box-containing protein